MAAQLASVSTAVKGFRARHRAYVLDIYAARLIAFMLSTRSFLRAFLLASSIVGFCSKFLASDLSIHVTAATANLRGQLALWTLVGMTIGFASVWIA